MSVVGVLERLRSAATSERDKGDRFEWLITSAASAHDLGVAFSRA